MDYAFAIWPRRHKVAGRWLKPLTLGHALLLQRLGSPFMPPDRPLTQVTGRKSDMFGPADVALLKYVCTRSWERALIGMDRWTIKPWLWWETLRRSKRIIEDAQQAIDWWQAEWHGAPTVFVDSKSAGRRGAGTLAILMYTQRVIFGKTFCEAASTPVREALWDHYCYLEAEGAVRIADATDDEADRLAQLVKEVGWNEGETPAQVLEKLKAKVNA